MNGRQFAPPVTEKTFDEYPSYTLEHPKTLHDRETKQVEWSAPPAIQSRLCMSTMDLKSNKLSELANESIRQQESYGILSNPKVWVMQEFKNSSENHLGMPLPKGRVRFYRRDDDGQLSSLARMTSTHPKETRPSASITATPSTSTGDRSRNGLPCRF